MTDLLVLPPPKRSRSRRLRKKLHIGEFQVLGFDYELTWCVFQTHLNTNSISI